MEGEVNTLRVPASEGLKSMPTSLTLIVSSHTEGGDKYYYCESLRVRASRVCDQRGRRGRQVLLL
jgi:hypothetical protein